MKDSRRKLRRFLEKCRFFLDEVLEHARNRRKISASEIDAMFRRGASIRSHMESTQRNPELSFHLQSVFSPSELETLRTPLKALYLCLLNNLRLNKDVLEGIEEAYSRYASDKSKAILFERNPHQRRNTLKGTLLAQGALSLRSIEDNIFKDANVFSTLIHALTQTEDTILSRSFLTLPISSSELNGAFDMIQVNIEAYVEASVHHDTLVMFLAKLSEPLVENRRRDVVALFSKYITLTPLSIAEIFDGYLRKFNLESLRNEIYRFS
ncbi:Uncharacterized protein FKW44_001315 [Caligus rogercresseyi]|uniref:Uncharacterized protein n=1 Tax=Caligus rogercresseyi TaxID=217165 RepID=A0A7T8KIW0_CALRO|nr:Uncharacterized protein FKW44_001315 [Caligus rogercresseyi]